MRIHKLKSSQNNKDSYPVFSVFFSAASSNIDTQKGAAVTSLRSFFFRDNFSVLTMFALSHPQIWSSVTPFQPWGSNYSLPTHI